MSEDDIIRARLLFEGDQGIDDRRILSLMTTFNKYVFDPPPNADENNGVVEKLFSLLYSVEHSHRLFQSTYQMDDREQLCYASKSRRMSEQIGQLQQELEQSELRLVDARQKRLHLLEYDARTATINKLGTRRELRAQQAATLERKHYFEHLQQTFEATYALLLQCHIPRSRRSFCCSYQQRLKQIAVYMRPIFELDEVLRQDAHEDSPVDGPMESPVELQLPVLTPILPNSKNERQRTNSDSSTASMDGDEAGGTSRSKRTHRSHLGQSSLSASLTNNQPQALFSSKSELYGTGLVNPLSVLSSSTIS